ncbi:MAG: Gfo/Idh/MocA family oxidoreductase [Erysipelotrichaceae bacterium]|nr:Gfo/Idh/MocA family oxidoreductase [Erysipelotrichaceae bacterium]
MKLVIFGCGKIANRIARSCKLVQGLELLGFASKDPQKAKEYCETYNCREYGDYDHFLDSDVDAVYIATYNNSHYELIRRCLEHGKNVICEKPMLFNVEMNHEMFELARNNEVLLMEALKSVFLPINIKVKQMVKEKTIGDIEEIYAAFMRNGSHGDDHWINDPVTGGALIDLGSYCVGTMNYITSLEPELVEKKTDRTQNKADSNAEVIISYAGIKGRARVSNDTDGDCFLLVKGNRGCIKAENFWKSGIGYYEIDNQRYELNEECISDFYYELRHFNDLVDAGMTQSYVMNESASENILKITSSFSE